MTTGPIKRRGPRPAKEVSAPAGRRTRGATSTKRVAVTVVAPPLVLLLNGSADHIQPLGASNGKSPRTPRLPLLSMFTGGGFMDIGFEQAGYEVVWTNELNPTFAEMYVAARKGTYIEGASRVPPEPNRSSVTDLSPSTVIREAFGKVRPELFGVIGGPPCPDFSRGGLQGGGTGANGRLTADFVSLLCKMRPAFFVMENVPGLFNTKKHRRFLESQLSYLRGTGGFLVDCKILNSLEYGAPQDRERLFVIGFSRKLAFEAVQARVSHDAHGWFPWPVDPRYAKARQLPWPTTSRFGGEPELPAGVPYELTVHAHFGPQNDPSRLPNGDEVFVAHSRKFWERLEGDVRHKSFKRLHRYRFSPTAWYGNQEVHLHPWLPRRLSVREALRLQTVPDDYVLPAGPSLGAKFKLICNGVPCVMARAVAEAVRLFLLQSPSAIEALKKVAPIQGPYAKG